MNTLVPCEVSIDQQGRSGQPDNNYFFALLDDEGSYRLYGKRGNTTQLIFRSLLVSRGWVTQVPAPNDVLYDEDLVLDEDGTFEIVVGPERPDDAKTDEKRAGAESLNRFTHSDWETERIDPYISSDSTPMGSRCSVDSSFDGCRFKRTSQSIRSNRSRIAIADRMVVGAYNSIFNMRVTPGGLVGQYSAFGNFVTSDETMLTNLGILAPSREFSSVIVGLSAWIMRITRAP